MKSFFKKLLQKFGLARSSTGVVSPEQSTGSDENVDLTNAIQSENYTEALALAQAKHLDGDILGTYTAAAMMICGDGCERDYHTAKQYLLPLAQVGDERAQYMLAGFHGLVKYQNFIKTMTPGLVIDDNGFWYGMMGCGYKSVDFCGVYRWLVSPLQKFWWRDIMCDAGIMCLKSDFGLNQGENAVKWLQRSADLGYVPAQEIIKKFSGKSED